MIGKWNHWFAGVEDPEPFGLSITYDLAYDWLKECGSVADWGCGKGWFSQYFDVETYEGVDGSDSPFVTTLADLTEYRGVTDGILLRHVLEHNYEWAKILDNAVACALERLTVILFTPLAVTTHQIAYAEDPGVPDISFQLHDITDRLEGFMWNMTQVDTATQYGRETVITAERA